MIGTKICAADRTRTCEPEFGMKKDMRSCPDSNQGLCGKDGIRISRNVKKTPTLFTNQSKLSGLTYN